VLFWQLLSYSSSSDANRLSAMGSRFVSAGTSDVGNVRGNNEDRVYIDDDRGIYLVVDGMGGQAAGEEAAEIAVKTVKGRLERQTEGAEQRVREAIALANNAIYEAASKNAAWRGMACVLTVALIENGDAVVGHVGDSRAYQIRRGRIEKITRDHSPVGEREDAGELSEEAAMRHPRRNEVFRDVGSALRTPDDVDFIEIKRVPVPDDSALLLCSDGLSDVVPSRRILQVVEENANDCQAAVKTLVRAAVADGKDNVSVVLVEGRSFSGSVKVPVYNPDHEKTKPPVNSPAATGRIAYFVGGFALACAAWGAFGFLRPAPPVTPKAPRTLHVGNAAGEYPTIPEAIDNAEPGDTIEVDPGTYPEKVALRPGITIRSTPPRAATVVGGIVAATLESGAVRDLAVGDAGIEINSSNLQIDGIETSGSVRYTGGSAGSLHGSRIATSVKVQDAASPEIGVNFIGGDIEFTSTGAMKLEGNAVQGVLFLGSEMPPALAAELLKRNNFSAKKPIQVLKLAGVPK
jgi:serine/threonine protein phosphatase PrpC